MNFVPRPLENLNIDELRSYARRCRSTIRENSGRLREAQAAYTILVRNSGRDGVFTYGGSMIATVGIVTTPILTPLGALALVGGAISLLGMGDQHAKAIERFQLRIDIENLIASDQFCARELRRIREEQVRRRR